MDNKQTRPMNVRGKLKNRHLYYARPKQRPRPPDRTATNVSTTSSSVIMVTRYQSRSMNLIGVPSSIQPGQNNMLNNSDMTKTNNHVSKSPVRQMSTDSSTTIQSFPRRFVRLLASHQYLIVICVLVVLDAAMTIGQLMIDLYIIRERFAEAEASLSTLADLLVEKYPHLQNRHVDHIDDLIVAISSSQNNHFVDSQLETDGSKHNSANLDSIRVRNATEALASSTRKLELPLDRRKRDDVTSVLTNERQLEFSACDCVNKTRVVDTICECAVSGDYSNNSDHGGNRASVHLFEEIAHSLHMASVAMLVLMAVEKLIKGLCQGEAFVKKKMEIFDSCILAISLISDVIFLQGIWSTTQKDAALFLVCLLPWRIIRILNCFVMTMKQRHHIRMQLQKRARRKAQKKVYLCKRHVDRLRRQIKSLKGLCRKHGAEEREINACAFVFTESRRRKSSLPVNAMSTMASIALIGVIGNDPHMPLKHQTSDEELHTLEEQDEDGFEDEMADIMPRNYTMNGNCHNRDDRKVSVISAPDSVEMSCASISMDAEESENASPLMDRRFSEENDADFIVELNNMSDDSVSDDSDGDTRDDKILKSRRFSTHDFLNKKRPSLKKKRGK